MFETPALNLLCNPDYEVERGANLRWTYSVSTFHFKKSLTISPELNPAVAGAQFPIGPTAYRNLETRPRHTYKHSDQQQLISTEVSDLAAASYSRLIQCFYLQHCVHGNGWRPEWRWRRVSLSGSTAHCQFSWSDNVLRHQYHCVHTHSDWFLENRLFLLTQCLQVP